MTSAVTQTYLELKNFPDISPEAFEVIRRIMKNACGVNLDSYKDKCIKRRIALRVRATNCITAEEYCDLLLRDEEEVDRLLKVLTIHVSQFFRNPPMFEKLRQEIFPFLFTLPEINVTGGLTVWSVGCASGEEPYTVALLLRHFFASELGRIGATILATDVDAAILEAAREGIFGEERLVEVSAELRRKYFVQRDGRYQVVPEIKSLVEFRQADLGHLDTFPECDLILCRNVFIYFERSQQEAILHGFADKLHPGGVLILGKSESLVGDVRSRFQTICPVERIYRRV
ncbi:chemotaxis protein CheR [Geobacter sp. AOG1]|nr:chemotaxis protein CheR [Geobacter sp. AOG1]